MRFPEAAEKEALDPMPSPKDATVLSASEFADRTGSVCWKWRLLLQNSCAVLLCLAASIWAAHSAALTIQGSYEFDFSALEMLFDVPRQCAYLTDFYGERVLKVSLTNGTVLAEVAFTNKPIFGVISPNRQRLYVSLWASDIQPNRGYVAEVDLDTLDVTASFPVSLAPTYLVATDSRPASCVPPWRPFGSAPCAPACRGPRR